MSAKAKTKSGKGKSAGIPANIVWFEIPADNVERTRKFYGALFDWKIKKFPGLADYWHIDTGGADNTPDGGLLKRKSPEHQGITNYILVASVDKSAAKVQKLGGRICMPKTAVPQMGHFVICQDTEGNSFALWEKDSRAK
jgi:uncharacterized protein